MLKRFLQNLALSAVATLVFLAACEGALWLAAPPPLPGLPQDLMYLGPNGWIITPNFHGEMDNRSDFRGKRVTADEQGRRIVPAAPASADHTLFVLGDSQTFGHGISDDEAWPNRLQERLNARALPWRVENHGVPAINVDSYVRKLGGLLPRIRPGDKVVVGVSWNDVITPQASQPMLSVVRGFLVENQSQSAVPADGLTVETRIKMFEKTGIIIPRFSDLKGTLEELSHVSALMHFLLPRAKAVWYRIRSDRPVQDLVATGVPEANFILLAEMSKQVQAAGAHMVVALLPDRIFFEDAPYRVYSVNGRDFPAQNFPGYLARPQCQNLNLDCVDSFDLLHDHQSEGLAYIVDGHYNSKGAALIGPWLAEALFPAR